MRNSYPATPDFQTLFEAAPVLYLVLLPDAPQYTIVAVSDAYARATMTRREEILGRGFFEVFPDNPADPTPTGAAKLRASLERVFTKRVPDAMAVQKYNIRRHAESGGEFEERWWSLKNSPVVGPHGEVAYIIQAVEDVTEKHHLDEERQLRDITERKHIEEKLNAANASLDAIVENIPLMLFIKESKSLRFVRFNRAGEDLLGWSKQAFIGKSDYDLWPQAQAQFFVEKDRETLKGRKIVDIPEEPIQTRHQGVRILHTKKIPILNTAGNPIYLLSISEDISEQRRIEKEQQFLAEASVVLSASLDYEQTLATVAQLVVRDFADWCVVDLWQEHEHARRIKVVSADPTRAALCTRLEQMRIDRTRSYLIRPVIETKQSLLIEHVTSEHLESVAQGPEHLEALRAVSPRSLMALPLLMRGQLLGTLSFISSTPTHTYGLSDLHLAEALADRAAIAIENARLYRASVQATQLRDQVFGVVAHDLRNPLSTILLQVSALKRHGPEPERRTQKPMEVIHRAAARMDRLIQDLLDVTLMEAGQLTIDPARLPAGKLVVEAVDMQRPLASSSSLELRVDLHSDVPAIWGDRDRLLQVFENLIGNAIKFTKTGGRITVGATSRDHEVVFWVADTGCGIPSENLPRVFDRFWQATRAGRQGAGLGLPITKGIVEAHGGRIWVESTEGHGTTFSFTIPEASPAQDRPSAVMH